MRISIALLLFTVACSNQGRASGSIPADDNIDDLIDNVVILADVDCDDENPDVYHGALSSVMVWTMTVMVKFQRSSSIWTGTASSSVKRNVAVDHCQAP